MNSKSSMVALGTAILLLSLALPGCGSDSSSNNNDVSAPEEILALLAEYGSPVQQFVGQVDDTNAYVAVSLSGSVVSAYVCDGAELIKWFAGTTSGSSLEGTASDGSMLDASLEGDLVTGALSIGDDTLTFSATAVSGQARLIEEIGGKANDPKSVVRRGWIVLEDGSFRGGETRPALATDQTSGGTTTGDVTTPPDQESTAGLVAKCKKIQDTYKRNVKIWIFTDDVLQRNLATTIIRLATGNWYSAGCDQFGSIDRPTYP